MLAVGDAMWVGTEGHGLLRIRGTAIEAIGGAPGATSLTILRLAVDADGVIWAATQRGLARVEHGQLTLPMPEVDVVANDVVCARDGAVYLGSTNGLYCYRRHGTRAWPGLHILSLAVGPDGTVFAASDTGLCRVTEDGIESGPGRWNMVPDMAVTSGADLLVLERARLRHLDAATLADREDPVDVGPNARRVWQDADGSLWVGCDGAGLNCLRRADLRRRGLGRATLLAAKADGGFYHSVSGTLFRTDAAGQRREIHRTPVDTSGSVPTTAWSCACARTTWPSCAPRARNTGPSTASLPSARPCGSAPRAGCCAPTTTAGRGDSCAPAWTSRRARPAASRRTARARSGSARTAAGSRAAAATRCRRSGSAATCRRATPAHGCSARSTMSSSCPPPRPTTPKPLATIIDVAAVGDGDTAASRHFRASFTAPTFANAGFVMFRHRLVGRDGRG